MIQALDTNFCERQLRQDLQTEANLNVTWIETPFGQVQHTSNKKH
jgi:hypothetical protein